MRVTSYGSIIQSPKIIGAQLLNCNDIRRQLPKVGDKLYKIPTVFGLGNLNINTEPVECVVTYVNKKNMWHEVQFMSEDAYFKETFKVPEVEWGGA